MRYALALSFAGIAVLALAFLGSFRSVAPAAQTALVDFGIDANGNPISGPSYAEGSYYEYAPETYDPCNYDDITCEEYYPSYDTSYSYSYPVYMPYASTPAPAPSYRTILPSVSTFIAPIAQPLLPKTQAQSAAAPSCAISANPSIVAYGGSSMLRWSSYGAQNAQLTGLGIVDTSGAWQFDNLTATKTFTLSLSGPGGTGTCATAVTVQPKPQPQQPTQPTQPSQPAQPTQPTGPTLYPVPVHSYTYPYQTYNAASYQIPSCNVAVTPTVITRGQTVLVSWSSPNGLRGTITDVNGILAPNGNTTITPSVSHPIVFAVSNQYGSNSCSTYITVNDVVPTTLSQSDMITPTYISADTQEPAQKPVARPSCTLAATPSTIVAGSPAMLSWTSKGAQRATLEGMGAVDASSTTYVVPAQTATYVLDVNGDGGAGSCKTTITVLPCPQSCANPVAAPAQPQQSGGFWSWVSSLFGK